MCRGVDVVGSVDVTCGDDDGGYAGGIVDGVAVGGGGVGGVGDVGVVIAGRIVVTVMGVLGGVVVYVVADGVDIC